MIPRQLFEGKWIGPSELASFLGVTRRTINRWESRGLLPKPEINTGKTRRWSVSTLNAAFSSKEINDQ